MDVQEKEKQLRNLRLLVADMLDSLEADFTVYHDVPEREKLFNYLFQFHRDLSNEIDVLEQYNISI